jgi:hypothetical protein
MWDNGVQNGSAGWSLRVVDYSELRRLAFPVRIEPQYQNPAQSSNCFGQGSIGKIARFKP